MCYILFNSYGEAITQIFKSLTVYKLESLAVRFCCIFSQSHTRLLKMSALIWASVFASRVLSDACSRPTSLSMHLHSPCLLHFLLILQDVRVFSLPAILLSTPTLVHEFFSFQAATTSCELPLGSRQWFHSWACNRKYPYRLQEHVQQIVLIRSYFFSSLVFCVPIFPTPLLLFLISYVSILVHK